MLLLLLVGCNSFACKTDSGADAFHEGLEDKHDGVLRVGIEQRSDRPLVHRNERRR